MKYPFSILFFVIINLHAVAQKYDYKIQLNNPAQAETIKYIQEKLFNMFDAMPAYDSNSTIFSVKSKYEITQDVFSQKIAAMGFTLVSFTKNPAIIKQKENEKMD